MSNGELLDAVTQTKAKFVLPPTWCWATVGVITENLDGRRVPLKADDRDGRSGPYPYYGASGIIDDIDDYLFDGEHLLIAEDGANLLSRSTPIAFRASGKFWVNNHAHVVQTRHSIPLSYLEWYLNGLDLQFFISGTAQPKLNQANLNKVPVPLAPINEQRRIVAKIEEVFSDLDAGVAALEQAKAKLKRYRAAVLKAAVEGKLTEEWRAKHPPKETASQLLERILKERRHKWEADQLAVYAKAGKKPPANWKDKYEEPSAPDETDLPALPEGWRWATVEQLSVVIRGSSPRPAGDPRYFGGNAVPWITVGCLTADEDPYLYRVPEFLTEEGRARSRYIEPDTLLLTNSGATLGVPKITMIGGCINDGSVALLQLCYPLKLYLYYFLTSQTKRLRAINQGAAQPNLNTGIVKAIVVPLPPQREQQAIVEQVEQRLSIAHQLAVQAQANLKRSSRLRQSILKRAFQGKLVPQDPNDEPASVLLERIDTVCNKKTLQRRKGW